MGILVKIVQVVLINYFYIMDNAYKNALKVIMHMEINVLGYLFYI
jgi:hypothetical protein